MTVQLPDFRLEVYLGEWEFKARYHLTASDAVRWCFALNSHSPR